MCFIYFGVEKENGEERRRKREERRRNEEERRRKRYDRLGTMAIDSP
jgi:thymidylate kinase